MYCGDYYDYYWGDQLCKVEIIVYFHKSIQHFFVSDDDYKTATDIVTKKFIKMEYRSLTEEVVSFKNRKFIWSSQINFSEFFDSDNIKDGDILFMLQIYDVVM